MGISAERFEKLDGLRGGAAIAVVLLHSTFYVDSPLLLVGNGTLWVDFFFALSGFVIAYAYHDSLGGRVGFRRYAILRLGRVYPLHLVVLVCWIPYVLLRNYISSSVSGVPDAQSSSPENFLRTILLLNSVGASNFIGWNYPSWSISAEVISYLAFYILAATLRTDGRLLVGAIIGSLFCAAFLLSAFPGGDILRIYDYGFVRGMMGFFAGVAIFLLRRRLGGRAFIPAGWGARLAELGCVLAIVLVLSSDLSGAGAMLAGLFVMFLTVAVFSSAEDGWVGAFLKTPLMRRLGELSYSIYMVHALVVAGICGASMFVFRASIVEIPFAQQGVRNALQGDWAYAANIGILLVVILVSMITYKYIEVPFREKARILASRY